MLQYPVSYHALFVPYTALRLYFWLRSTLISAFMARAVCTQASPRRDHSLAERLGVERGTDHHWDPELVYAGVHLHNALPVIDFGAVYLGRRRRRCKGQSSQFGQVW